MNSISGIEGLGQLSKNFERLINIVDESEFENGLLKIARVFKGNVSAHAPIAPKGHYKRGTKIWVEPGNLKHGIVAKKFRHKIPGQPATFVGINYRIAPHAHLVEYGHGGPHPAPAHPFFRPEVDGFKATYVSMVASLLRRLFSGGWIRPGKAAEAENILREIEE